MFKMSDSFRSQKRKLSVKQLVFCAMGITLALVTSYIKLWDMPMGGSVTLMSMFFISLVGYWYGLRTGILTGVAYGALQLVIDPYIISLPQLFLDYFFAFGALGLSGLFSGRKNGLFKGYILSVSGRFIFTFISGVVFFGSAAIEYGLSVPVYSALYNGGYIVPEAILTLFILALPPVKSVLQRLETMSS